MRKAFCQSMVQAANAQDSLVFLTGDLGFMALEPLRDALGGRFINAGVAEQNMVSMSAGLAKNGLKPWVYSIAPFIYARPFEQIRNDICLHRMPVVIVGNGGGYGYGVMGATHHALEDYGILLALPNIRAYVPAFDEDLRAIISKLMHTDHPAYLRLGLTELPKDQKAPAYAPWRKLMKGSGWVVLVAGPLAGGYWQAFQELPTEFQPNLWALTELPIQDLPEEFIADLNQAPNLLVAEEHVAQGGIGQMMASRILTTGLKINRFEIRSALGYPSKRYGSQQFHRRESGLDVQSIMEFLKLQACHS